MKKVPRGQVATYKELARAVNRPRAARAIGNVVHKNPWAPQVPCHRVVKSNGEIGGYAGGEKKKIKLLESEGVKVRSGKIIKFKDKLYKFK